MARCPWARPTRRRTPSAPGDPGPTRPSSPRARPPHPTSCRTLWGTTTSRPARPTPRRTGGGRRAAALLAEVGDGSGRAGRPQHRAGAGDLDVVVPAPALHLEPPDHHAPGDLDAAAPAGVVESGRVCAVEDPGDAKGAVAAPGLGRGVVGVDVEGHVPVGA